MKYMCENCNAVFDKEEEAHKHEKFCTPPDPAKQLILIPDGYAYRFSIRTVSGEEPDESISGDDDGWYYVSTADFSEEHEKALKRKLILSAASDVERKLNKLNVMHESLEELEEELQ